MDLAVFAPLAIGMLGVAALFHRSPIEWDAQDAAGPAPMPR
jgi:hypothetical protein